MTKKSSISKNISNNELLTKYGHKSQLQNTPIYNK